MHVPRNLACSIVVLFGIVSSACSPSVVELQEAPLHGLPASALPSTSGIMSTPRPSTDNALSASEEPTRREGLADDPEDIVDLPDALSVTCQSSYGNQWYSFDLQEARRFDIEIVNDGGTIELGIWNDASKEFVLPRKAYATESTSVNLDAGSYRVVVVDRAFCGSYRVQSEADDRTTDE